MFMNSEVSIMINHELLKKYAKLAVRCGANVQKNQVVMVNSSIETKELAREIVLEAYEAGASRVVMNWSDDYISNYNYQYRTIESLEDIPQYKIDKYRGFIDQGGCVITIKSTAPDINNNIEPSKIQALNIATRKALSFYYDHMMASQSQWTIVCAPNPLWAQKVFPEMSEDDAINALWEAILKASRVDLDTDSVENWLKHREEMLTHNNVLNEFNFDRLIFKNGIGTDVTIKLANDHIWCGGADFTPEGLVFSPNIPTEESFTMPYKYGVNGKIVATKPLNYLGSLIEDFWFEFKDGKVVDFDAKSNKEALQAILDIDEGGRYLGEVALISHESPISSMGLLFYNTLFDENASCHVALGRAYKTNVKDGTIIPMEELKAKGYNHSISHTDFMFGSADMSIVGITKDGKEVVVFKNGNFVI